MRIFVFPLGYYICYKGLFFLMLRAAKLKVLLINKYSESPDSYLIALKGSSNEIVKSA